MLNSKLIHSHAMEVLTEILNLGYNLFGPLLVILLDEIPLLLIIELFNQTTVLNVSQHLKVGLTLNRLIIPNPPE